MNTVGALRRMFALLAVLLIALALCTWLVISLAAQLSGHNERQTTATEFALTLTRLANLVVAPGDKELPVDGIRGDPLAQLLAMGDVQSRALAAPPSTGWFKSPGSDEFARDVKTISTDWISLKSALADLNASALNVGDGPADYLLSQASLDAVEQSFAAVFNGVTNESLSVPLLQVLSEVKAELASLQFLNKLPAGRVFVQPFNSSLERFKAAVETLKIRAQGQQGGSLIGYESTIALQNFIENIALLKPVTFTSPRDAGELNPLAFSNAQGMIQNAISRNEVTRRALDSAIYQYRRAILGALACLCAALLLAALVTWRIWSLKRKSQHLNEDDLGDMVVQISAIADGNLAVNVRPLSGDSPQAQQSRLIANAVNHTEKMFRSLVQVSRGVASRTADLASHQQQITQSLIDSRLPQNQDLTGQIENLQQCAGELSAICGNESPANQGLLATADQVKGAVVSSNTTLAAISSQVELGSSRISRASDAVGELSVMVEKIKATAEQSSLKALNTSIQMSAYSDGDDLDASPQFIDDVLKVSGSLSASATDAQRLVESLKNDLQASGLALVQCNQTIEGSADRSLKSMHLTAALVDELEEFRADRERLLDALKSGGDKLTTAADSVRSSIGDGSSNNEQHAELMRTAWDIQELAGNFEESLSRYQLNTEETSGG